MALFFIIGKYIFMGLPHQKHAVILPRKLSMVPQITKQFLYGKRLN